MVGKSKKKSAVSGIKKAGIITALAILGVGAAIYFGFQYISNRLIWGNATLKFTNTSLTSTVATISWPLQNKTAIAYLFQSFTGKLTYNGGKLADVVMNEPLTIPAGATATMSMDVPISFIGAGALILSAITQGQWTAPIMLEGMATVNNVPVPVNMDMNILPI
jgi:hypothetical protein